MGVGRMKTKFKSQMGPYVAPYDNKEKHFPGMNYCGPGTNVWRRMRNNVRPVDRLDLLCYRHDLDTEPRGPYKSQGKRKLLRASDRRLIKGAERLKKEGYKPEWKINAVIEGMRMLLITGARGR